MSSMSNTETFPVDMHGWIILRNLGKVRMRAVRIDLKGDVTDTDGHRVREAVAEGGVKIRPKLYDISKF